MGQGHPTGSNPMFDDWQKHATQPNTYYNAITKEKVQSFLVYLTKNQELFLRKRLQEQHNFINKILYFEPAERVKTGVEECKYFVYVQKTYPISAQKWVPVTSVLSILKGFRRLSSNYGMIRVTPNMIRVNDKKQIRVWINENPLKNQPSFRVQSQQRMLADIVKIVMEYDAQTGALMMKCMTINQAINNILHNMTETKTQVNFSNRTNKNEDKTKLSNKQIHENTQQKINFRSTKQTQDDSLKIFHDSGHKNPIKREIQNIGQLESPKNLLQNVVVTKPPTYINVDRYPNQQRVNYDRQKTEVQASLSRDCNFSQQNNMQKQSSIQFNSSHPTKMPPSNRPFKPVEHKNQNYVSSVNNPSTMSSQMSHGYERPHADSEKYGQKHSQYVNKASQLPYYPQRKSNLNKNFLERMQTSQESQVGSNTKGKGSVANERSEINTSRQIETHSFNRPRMLDQNGYFQSSRTKTQQFYSTNNQRLGNSPRIRTNYIQSTSQMQKQVISPTNANNLNTFRTPQHILPIASQTMYLKAPDSPKFAPDKAPVPQSTKQQQTNQDDERRQTKLKQAQQIKQELNGLGILSSASPRPLANDKSARDLLIKQKIQEKNKKHEELKFAITRLLSQ